MFYYQSQLLFLVVLDFAFAVFIIIIFIITTILILIILIYSLRITYYAHVSMQAHAQTEEEAGFWSIVSI